MAKIEKIYQITLSGEQDLISKMKTVNQLFEESKKRWKELKLETSKGLSAADLAQYKLAIQQGRIETEKLKQETIKLRNESIVLANQNKINAGQNQQSLNQEKIETEKLKQEKIKLANESISLTNQNKQNAAAQRQAREEARNSVDAYRKLNDQYKQAKANALNYGASLGTQSREFKSASAEAKRYYDQLRQIEAGVGIHNRNVGNYPNNMGAQFSQNIKQYFDDMKGQLASFAVGYIGFQSAMNLAERFKNDAIQADAMGSALAGVSEKTGDLATNQKFLDEISERLGLKIIDNTRNFKTFFAAFTESGGAPAIAREIYSDALEASAKMKLSQDQTNGVMLAFGQIASKGKVQAEELIGQIGERIPGAFGIAAKAMGMTTQELDAAMKKGEVYSSEFLPKFAAQLKQTYSVGQESVKGLQAELNRLDNMITKIGSSKAFIDTFSTFVSIIMLLINVMGKVPFSAWLSIIGLITLAYWANIQAMIVHNATLAVTVVRLGLTNGALIILGATYRVHLILVGLLEGGLRLLIATMNLMGISTVRLKGFIIGLNLTLSATPWGLILGLIVAVGAATMAYATTTEKATGKLKDHKKVLQDNINVLKAQEEINKKAGETISGITAKIKINTAIINDNKAALKSKKEALQNIIDINPTYLKGLTLENFHTAQGIKILEDYKNKLLEVAKAKAVKDSLEEDYKKQFDLDQERSGLTASKKAADKYKNDVFDKRSWGEFGRGVGGLLGIGDGDAEDKLNKNLKETETIVDRIRYKEDLFKKNTEKGLYNQKYVDGLLGGSGVTPANPDDKGKDKPYRGSRLTGVQKDYLKDLEAARNQALAIIEKQYTEGQILETEYIEKSLATNLDYFNKKIAYLKSGNAEERKQEAQAQLDKSKAVREANDKLYALNKKRLDDELKQNEDDAQRKRDTVINNPYSTEQEKINAEKTYHSDSTTAQLKYNQDMIDLENKLSKSMIEEANARNRVLQQKLDEENSNNLQSRINNLKADVSDVDKVKDQVDNQNEINAAVAKRNILGDKRLNQQRKENELSLVNAQLVLSNTNAELGAVISKITLYEQEITKRKLTNDELREYNRLLKEKATLEGQKAEGEVNVTNAQGKSKSSGNGVPGSGMSGLANVATKGALGSDGKMNIAGVDVSESAAYAIAQGFSIAEQAMNSYFDAERDRIERSRQLAYDRIDLEKEQLLRYAQTNGEREAIDKQAAAKKKKADKEAGEQLKKTKKAEAKIAFLMELANIWSTVWQLGPIAGPIMGGFFTALAGVKYAMTIGNINKTQYGRGGKLKGPSHSDNNGMPVINPKTNDVQAYLEGDEGIINRRSMNDSNQYTISGTPSQIASKINSIGGGVDWFGGATISKFKSGGLFNWNRTQPPVFNSQIQKFEDAQMQSETNDRMDRAEMMIEALAKEQSKKVVLNPKEVTKFQKENYKQTEIGTL